MKKRAAFILLCIILYLVPSKALHAQEQESRGDGLDITFVIDCSGSMKANDPKGMGMQMVKAFIDTVHAEEIRVGYVAYNDAIVSSCPPVPISEQEKREELKSFITEIPYAGDTDIGLGMMYAYRMMPKEEGRRRVIVLISDGESDLDGSTGRTLEQSDQDLSTCVRQCRDEEVPVYTIAFGTYDGDTKTLKDISGDTGAESYSAENPEKLIEVLYGIFDNNLSYKIQQFSSGIYAGGEQEIRCILDEMYLDEMDILLISSGDIGETVLEYGDKQIPVTGLSHYGVGKIGSKDLDPSIKELTVRTSTAAGQNLRIFVISYRSLVPVLNIETSVSKNADIAYQVYLKDKNGEIIEDREYYRRFHWELECPEAKKDGVFTEVSSGEVEDEILKGVIRIGKSGTYKVQGKLSDNFGSYSFDMPVTVTNTPPVGSLPDTSCTVLSREISYDLDQYFTDQDKDVLHYYIEEAEDRRAEVRLDQNSLSIVPESSGLQQMTLLVSDGEDTFAYPFQVRILPLWQAYWWVIALALAAAWVIWKLLHRPKPKPELDQIAEAKAGNQFAGRMDAYVIQQPEDAEEIPPLTFPMHKIKDVRVCIGDLMREYPELSDALELDQVFLIADENRKMVLYHSSSSTIMIGSAIICRQIQYHVCFGDIVYITSPDGLYELEIHYIAMFQ